MALGAEGALWGRVSLELQGWLGERCMSRGGAGMKCLGGVRELHGCRIGCNALGGEGCGSWWRGVR